MVKNTLLVEVIIENGEAAVRAHVSEGLASGSVTKKDTDLSNNSILFLRDIATQILTAVGGTIEEE